MGGCLGDAYLRGCTPRPPMNRMRLLCPKFCLWAVINKNVARIESRPWDYKSDGLPDRSFGFPSNPQKIVNEFPCMTGFVTLKQLNQFDKKEG